MILLALFFPLVFCSVSELEQFVNSLDQIKDLPVHEIRNRIGYIPDSEFTSGSYSKEFLLRPCKNDADYLQLLRLTRDCPVIE
jgi:hypothetical protein